MDLRPITPAYAVSPQIAPQDVAAIAEAGYKSIMCNRPDGEEYGQPTYASVEQAAAEAGLEIRWVPITNAGVGQEDLAQFRAALDEMPQPLLAFCRTGTRSTMMWTIAQHATLSDQEILGATSQAGYDMSGILRQLSAR